MRGRWIACFLQLVFPGLPSRARTVTCDFAETGQPDNVFDSALGLLLLTRRRG